MDKFVEALMQKHELTEEQAAFQLEKAETMQLDSEADLIYYFGLTLQDLKDNDTEGDLS